MSAAESWNAIAEAILLHQPTAVLVSPEIYFEQAEFMQNVCSEYVSTAPEHARLPWLAIAGVPVAVDPSLAPRKFALLHSRDYVDDMRIALDIYTHGMETEEFTIDPDRD
jgi:hypothetical protein